MYFLSTWNKVIQFNSIHCYKVFNTKRVLHLFLRTLKVFNIEKGLHQFLVFLRVLILKNDSVTFLQLVKFFKIAIMKNFSGMRRLILVLMSNVCYLAVILIFLVVTWWLLLITWWFLLVTGGYCSLPLVTARSHF